MPQRCTSRKHTMAIDLQYGWPFAEVLCAPHKGAPKAERLENSARAHIHTHTHFLSKMALQKCNVNFSARIPG